MTIAQKKIYEFLKSKGGSSYLLDCQQSLGLSDIEMKHAVIGLIEEGLIYQDTYVQPSLHII